MLNHLKKYKTDYLVLLCFILASVFFYVIFGEVWTAEVVLLIGVIVLSLLQREKPKDMGVAVIALVLLVFTVHSSYNVPEASLEIDVYKVVYGNLPFDSNYDSYRFTGVYKHGDLELSQFVRKDTELFMSTIGESIINKTQYFLIIRNNGSLPVKSLSINIESDLPVEYMNVTHKDARIQFAKPESDLSLGDFTLKLDNLAVGDKVRFTFNHPKDGSLYVMQCWSSSEPIDCSYSVDTSYLVPVPEDRMITELGERLLPELSRDGHYKVVDGELVFYRTLDFSGGDDMATCDILDYY